MCNMLKWHTNDPVQACVRKIHSEFTELHNQYSGGPVSLGPILVKVVSSQIVISLIRQ